MTFYTDTHIYISFSPGIVNCPVSYLYISVDDAKVMQKALMKKNMEKNKNTEHLKCV